MHSFKVYTVDPGSRQGVGAMTLPQLKNLCNFWLLPNLTTVSPLYIHGFCFCSLNQLQIENSILICGWESMDAEGQLY